MSRHCPTVGRSPIRPKPDAGRTPTSGREVAPYNPHESSLDPLAAPHLNPYASLYVLLCLFWVLLSGYFTPFLLAAGAGSALAVV